MEVTVLTRFMVMLGIIFMSIGLTSAEERILDYNTHIQVKADGELLITESIKVNAEHAVIRRGIYRDIPTVYTLANHQTQHVGFEIISILRDGQSEPFHTEKRQNGTRIYIGDSEKYVSKGEHSYQIFYRTNRQIQFLDQRDELYFNAIGHGFSFPIDNASTTISLPSSAYIKEYKAFTGAQGSTASHVDTYQSLPFEVEFKTSRPLNSREGMTVLLAWNKGVVSPPSDFQHIEWGMQDYRETIYAAISTLIVFVYLLIAWFVVGRDPKGSTIIPLFTPPEGLSPAACQFIKDRRFKPSAFTGALVNLAVKGFLTIEASPSKNTYTLSRTGKTTDFFPSEKTLAAHLFSNNLQQQTIGGKYSSTIANAKTELKHTLTQEYAKQNFINNRLWFFMGVVICVVLGAMMAIQDQRFELILLSASAGIFGVVFVTSIRSSIRAVKSTSPVKTLIRLIPVLLPVIFIFTLGGPFLSSFDTLSIDLNSMAIPAYYLISALLLMLFYWLLEAPTLAGRATLDKIEGFKHYLSVAEKDLLNFQHPPDKTPELFERYLPYAISLGVENEWGEKFTALLAASALSGGTAMNWYHGHTNNDFSNLTSNMSNGLDSAIASSSTPPSSSGSGFSGGSSGGGGGGGGGGGW
ncbi:DUF2207 domain-containing protein [Neptunomonas antarctica]|uniref:Predicted membrane protein n=1 Tax=Neptunomonas antarctica TaxID=619304 RepID=A0A1N7NQE3_9GAMM|nr:DUF2207 domain-containing protein [Neptunomonas antarctica]SIT00507.1 Predicted membrane protein [Neptunomonas antarctica]